MSGHSTGFALSSRGEWRCALAEQARSDGAVWIHALKVLYATLLAFWLVMRLELL